MKNLLTLITALLFTSFFSYSQAIETKKPALSPVNPFALQVGFTTTTILIFPSKIFYADRGYKEILAQKINGFENILAIKAVKRNILPTDLHVFTADGKIYDFNISYVESPLQTTYDLSLISPDSLQTYQFNFIFSDELANEMQTSSLVEKVKHSRAFFDRQHSKYGTKLRLRTIHVAANMLLFGFSISNNSVIPFDVDFIRMYVRDQKKVKRSTIQQTELVPTYKTTIDSISAYGKMNFVFVLPKFTMPDNKEFIIEVYEKNGGRNIALTLHNKQLLRARKIQI